jgi:hypothetical protein
VSIYLSIHPSIHPCININRIIISQACSGGDCRSQDVEVHRSVETSVYCLEISRRLWQAKSMMLLFIFLIITIILIINILLFLFSSNIQDF